MEPIMTRLFNVVKPKFSGASKWGYGIKLQDNGESGKFNMILANDKPAAALRFTRKVEISKFGY
jgi:hypothetical protein